MLAAASVAEMVTCHSRNLGRNLKKKKGIFSKLIIEIIILPVPDKVFSTWYVDMQHWTCIWYKGLELGSEKVYICKCSKQGNEANTC